MIPDTFNIIEQGDERLITPGFAVANYQWREWPHRWLRSLHIDGRDRIISAGFPKFMNIGEGNGRFHVDPEDILRKAGQDLWATLKIDGSMLIRFVQNGQVKWRTRGSFKIGLENVWELNDIWARHPKLIDPSYRPDDSLLFEWVSPINKIVITYPEASIILIGGVRYDRDAVWHESNPSLYSFKDLQQVASETNVPIVEGFPLNSERQVTALLDRIKAAKDIEGFVIRFNDQQEMVKVKSEHYLILHALRSNLTTNKLVELWISWGKPNFQSFAEKFGNTYDYECWTWALPVVSEMFDGIKKANKIIANVQDFVAENQTADRKTFALAAQDRFNQLRLTLCFILYDHRPIPDDLVLKFVLQNCKQMDRSMFEKE